MLGKDARVAAREHRGHVGRVCGERRFRAAHGEQALVDADLAELRVGDGFEHDIERLPHLCPHLDNQSFVWSHVSIPPTARAMTRTPMASHVS